jgi:hypothetical protein
MGMHTFLAAPSIQYFIVALTSIFFLVDPFALRSETELRAGLRREEVIFLSFRSINAKPKLHPPNRDQNRSKGWLNMITLVSRGDQMAFLAMFKYGTVRA